MRDKAFEYKPITSKDKGDQFKRNSIFTELTTLTWRTFMQLTRNYFPFIILIVQNVVIGAIIGAIYSSTQYNSTGVQNRLGLLFFVTINISFS